MNKQKVVGDLIRHRNYQKGKDFGCTVVLRPNIVSMISKFNLFIALGIRDAIQHFSNGSESEMARNGIYIDNGKVCWFLN